MEWEDGACECVRNASALYYCLGKKRIIGDDGSFLLASLSRLPVTSSDSARWSRFRLMR
jgi:hypothetical protein